MSVFAAHACYVLIVVRPDGALAVGSHLQPEFLSQRVHLLRCHDEDLLIRIFIKIRVDVVGIFGPLGAIEFAQFFRYKNLEILFQVA